MRKINKFVSILGISLMGGSVLLPAVQVMAEETGTNLEQNVEADPYTPEALAAYEKARTNVNIAQVSKSVDAIRKGNEAFIAITSELNSENYGAYLPHDIMDQIFFDVYFLMYDHLPEEQKAEVILNFAEEWQKVLLENYNSLYVHHFRYFVMENTIEEIQPELEDLLIELNRWANGIPSEDGIIPLPTEDEMQKIIDDFFDEYGADDPDPEAPTEQEIEDQINKDNPQLDGDDVTSETVRYEKIGNDWVQITETIKNGKVIKTERRTLSKDESYFLRVQEDPFYDPYNTVENVEYVTDREWSYFTSNQNPESKWTIQYTVNKDDNTPYYYDTGIRVNENKQATYEQYKDVLLVLADKTGGYLVEDKSKLLVVLEGKPIVVKDAKEFYSKKELESIFKEFERVDIRIMETKIGKAGSLEEQIVTKQAQSVKVDGNAVELAVVPTVKNERAMLPVEEIAYALGGTVQQNGSSYIVKKGGNEVIFRTNDKAVYVNGKAIGLANTPVVENNVLMAEVSEMATALGYNMVWDAESSTIYFEKR